MKIFGINIEAPVFNKKPVAKPGRALAFAQRQPRTPQVDKLDLSRFRPGFNNARSALYPRREILYGNHRAALLDDQVISLYNYSISKVANMPWQIEGLDGRKNDALTQMLQKPWFRKEAKFILQSPFWGHSLIQLGDIIEGEVSDCWLIPRDNVRPEDGLIIAQMGDQAGINYRDPQYYDWITEAGDTHDLGLLLYVYASACIKQYTITSWNKRAHRFGMPNIFGHTDVNDDVLKANMAAALASLGEAGIGVIGLEDKIAYLESNSGQSGHQVYMELCKYMDGAIGKIMVGASSTNSEKSYVGTAQTQERMSDDILADRAQMLMEVRNSQTLPNLIAMGFTEFEGMRFKILDQVSAEEQLLQSQVVKNLSDAGFDLDEGEIKDKFGYTVTKKEVVETTGSGGFGKSGE